MWTCPHCGAPQAEAARCWVCRRSSTTCSTCRHFRTALSVELGYCARDRRRTPLTGRELRGCWAEGVRTAASATPDGAAQPRSAVARGDGGPLDRPDPMRLRGFVPIDELVPPAAVEAPEVMPSPALLAEPPAGWETRTNLFGDAETIP